MGCYAFAVTFDKLKTICIDHILTKILNYINTRNMTHILSNY